MFAPTFPMGHAFCLTRLVMCFFFSLSSLRPDVRSKEHTSLFCLLASISLRITWDQDAQLAYKHAIELDSSHIQIYVNQRDVLLNKGKKLYESGNIEEACNVYEQTTIFYPTSTNAYACYGKILYEIGHYQDASRAYKQAIYLDSSNIQIYKGLLRDLLSRGDQLTHYRKYEEALTIYEHAVYFDPSSPQAYLGLGKSLYELKHYEKAREAYDQAIRLDKSLTATYLQQKRGLHDKGKGLFKLKHYEEALVIYEQVLRFDPTDKEAHTMKADILEKLNRHQEALAVFKAVSQMATPTEETSWMCEEPFRYE